MPLMSGTVPNRSDGDCNATKPEISEIPAAAVATVASRGHAARISTAMTTYSTVRPVKIHG